MLPGGRLCCSSCIDVNLQIWAAISKIWALERRLPMVAFGKAGLCQPGILRAS